MSESIDHSWICREDFGIERNQSFKGDHGNAQFSLCCTSTAMPDDDSQDRHPAFYLEIKLGIEERRKTEKRVRLPPRCQAHTLFLDPRNMSCGNLPTTIALDQRVGELHHAIKWFAIGCSFHMRFAKNDRCVIAIKAR
jgi:hypothetical protein